MWSNPWHLYVQIATTRTGSLQNSWTSSYSGQSEKEINKIGGGKAGGRVADQPGADEVPARSSPGGETPGDHSNSRSVLWHPLLSYFELCSVSFPCPIWLDFSLMTTSFQPTCHGQMERLWPGMKIASSMARCLRRRSSTIDLKQMFNTFPRLPESTIFAFLVAADSYTLQNMFEEWRDQRKNLPLREMMSLRYYQGPDAGLDVYFFFIACLLCFIGWLFSLLQPLPFPPSLLEEGRHFAFVVCQILMNISEFLTNCDGKVKVKYINSSWLCSNSNN